MTDPTNASRTMLYSLAGQGWDQELLTRFTLPPSLLPRVAPSSGVVGDTDPEHFGVPLPIAGIAGDQQAALFGQGCVTPGLAKNTYGTGAFLLLYAGDRLPSPPEGLLVLEQVQLEGRNPTPSAAFRNGYRDFVGSRLG